MLYSSGQESRLGRAVMSSSIAGAADARPELIASTIPLLDVAPYLAAADSPAMVRDN